MPAKLSTPEFVQKAKTKHNNKYDYSLVNYVKSSNKILIICPSHGPFEQRANDHLTGYGCRACGLETIGNGKRKKLDVLITTFKQVHGNRYDYSRAKYVNSLTNISIICSIHGLFEQTPANHINGKGCYKCGRLSSGNKKRLSTIEFIEKSSNVHGNKYDYSLVNYYDSKSKVQIVCKKHGLFESTPNNHLQGYGCPKCNHRISNTEIAWLDYHNIPNTIENRQVIIQTDNTRYIVDGFIPETNTVYEFLGDYWHGNPKYYNETDINTRSNKTYGTLYKETLEKMEKLIILGYNLVCIWESEWLIQTNQPLYLTYQSNQK